MRRTTCLAAALTWYVRLVTSFSRATPAEAAATVLRTLVYHEITSLASSPNTVGQQAPILSENGNRAAFAMAPGAGSPDNPNRILVINADGTGQREVDAYTSLCFCGSIVDISADGGKIISSDAIQLRISNADGTGKRTLIALDSNEITAISISGDGTKVFFRLLRDTSFRGTNPAVPIQRGVWVINSDGTGLSQVAGPINIAALLGITPGEVSSFGPFTPSLDSSFDGSRIVFGMFIQPEAGGFGQGLIGINRDGTGARNLLGRVGFLYGAGISRDGTKAGYNITPVTPGNLNQTGAVNFDGTGNRILGDSTTRWPGTGFNVYDSGDRVQLTANGDKMLSGTSSVLFNTDGSGRLQLGASGFQLPRRHLVDDGLFRPTMNGAGTRFLYLTPTDPNDPVATVRTFQLATVDINPGALGSSPSVTQPDVNPPFVVTNGASTATVEAKVTTSQTLIGVNAHVFRNAISDPAMSWPILVDNGTAGDRVANDKIFTNSNLFGNSESQVGPRTLRVKGEVRTAAGRRHATAVDFEPFEVLAALPVPTITQVHPRKARRGSELLNSAIKGASFFSNPTVRFLLNGAPDTKITVANLVVVDATELRFTANIAADAALGDRVVQVVTGFGASATAPSAANKFTVSDLPDPADTDPPTIRDNSVDPTRLPRTGGDVNFATTVSDNRDIGPVTVEITRPNGTKTTVTLAAQPGANAGIETVSARFTGKFTAPANATEADQIYKTAFLARDAAGNQAGPVRTESFVVPGSVPDTDAPAISANTVDPSSFPAAGGVSGFSITARDNVSLASARALITRPDNSTATVNLTRVSSSRARSGVQAVSARFTGSFTAPRNTDAGDKRYRVQFFAKDDAGNEAGPVNAESIVVQGTDSEPPSIIANSVTPSDFGDAGGVANLSVTVRDDASVASARVRITRPDNTTQDINLTRAAGANPGSGVEAETARFTGTFTAPANAAIKAKRYRVAFFAKDGANNEIGPITGDSIIVEGSDAPPNILGASSTPSNLPTRGGSVTVTAQVQSIDPKARVIAQAIKIVNNRPKTVAQAQLTFKSGTTFRGTLRIPANATKKAITYGIAVTVNDGNGTDGPALGGSVKVAKKK